MSHESQGIGSRIKGSAGPAQGTREVMVVGRHAPTSAGQMRWHHMKRLFGARKYILPTALVGGALFLLGATSGNPVLALAPLLVVLGFALTLIWREASRMALDDFLAGYALEHHFNYTGQMGLVGATPLLAAGDRRRCEHYMEGPLHEIPGASIAMAHFVFEIQEKRNDRRNRPISVFRPHNFTIAVVEIPRAASALPGVFLSRRTRLGNGHEWLGGSTLLPVPLSDRALESRAEMEIRAGVDRGRLLELMTPGFQAWLSELTLPVFCEYENGTLVVYAPRRLKLAGEFDALLAAAKRIAKQVSEAGEPLHAVGEADSAGPPHGVAAFPAPPPATKPRVEPHLHVAPEPEPDQEAQPTYKRVSTPPPAS